MNKQIAQLQLKAKLMKYWYILPTVHNTESKRFGEEEILLKDGRILSVVKNKEGIRFTEEGDGHFSVLYTKEDALKLVDELKAWINAS